MGRFLPFLQGSLITLSIWFALSGISYAALRNTFHLTRPCQANEVKHFSP